MAEPTNARWIDIGLVAPAELHAAYTGVAYAMGEGAAPAVVWGRARPHLCLGQSQGLCEVAPDIDVPVVRRPLGGGAVWVDEDQYCYALVMPRTVAPPRPSGWFAWALAPARRTLEGFGLPARLEGGDLWVRGRKIAGSGAATLGCAAVVASSFLMRFPRHRFAGAVAAPSPAYRRWLEAALRAAMTDWEGEGTPPEGAALARAFRDALDAVLGWRTEDARLDDREQAEIAAARAELAEPIEPGRRLTPHGIKLNQHTFLTETPAPGFVVRELRIAGRARRREVVSLTAKRP